MKNLSSLLFLSLFLLLNSCGSSDNSEAASNTVEEFPKVTDVMTTYTAAFYNEAQTRYDFTDKNDNTIQFTVSNSDTSFLPQNMLRKQEELGPIIANPPLVGKRFQIYFDDNGEVDKVEQIDHAPVVEAVFEDATVYAGKIDYLFTAPNGESFFISKGADIPEGNQPIKIPEDLISYDGDDAPMANPDKIGKKFKLFFYQDNSIGTVKAL